MTEKTTTEILLTTTESNLQWTISAWDYNSGNSIHFYKNGGNATGKTLATLGNDYFLTGEYNKPLLHVWPVNSQEQVKNFRIVLPETANCIAISPNNCYLVIGMGVKFYVWQIESGKLLNVQQKHYQAITCIRFSSDGDFIVVAGQDGMVLTYNFSDLINIHRNVLSATEQIEPLYKRMDHTRPISDLFIGNFGYKSRFATVSTDQTCRVYNLLKGEQLLCLFFNESLTSVVFNPTSWNLYIGGVSGKIYNFNLKSPPRNIEFHSNNQNNHRPPLEFVGHEKKITCLDLNVTATILASGSEDCKILIWDVISLQKLRQLDFKSPITNIRFILNHENFVQQQFKPKIVLKSLERNLNLTDNFTVAVIQDEDISFSDDDDDDDNNVVNKSCYKQLDSLQTEIVTVKVINQQLYEYLLKLTEKINNKT